MRFGLGGAAEKNGSPRIESVSPAAAIPGGEVTIVGSGFTSRTQPRPQVKFGDAEASLALSSGKRLIARVPDGAIPQMLHDQEDELREQLRLLQNP